MDRNANVAPALGDATVESLDVATTQVRSVARNLSGDEHRDVATPGAQPLSAHQPPVRPLSPGTCVAGKYVICDVLGTGGAAVVYAAEQMGLKRVVAFKLYPVGGAVASHLLARFEREAQLLARVHHENVVAVFDAGSMPDGSPYLVVQRLRGDSLAARLLTGPLPIAEAVELARQVLSALSALSDAGITHRDVKPGNLVLDRDADGRTVLKLVDFGIAKQTHDEWSRELDEMVGTPHYMAPEQVCGEGIDPRADLYALGATLYEMLTGRTPHGEEPQRELTHEPVTPVRALRRDCPEALERLVMRALAREPSQRFASAREMRSALDQWQDPRQPASEARDPALDEDTLRISTALAAPGQPRSKLRQRTTRALSALALMSGLALVQQLPVRSLPVGTAQPLAAGMAQAESSPFEPLLRGSALASELLLHTTARAGQLVSQLHTTAQELLQTVHHQTRAWGAEAMGPASER